MPANDQFSSLPSLSNIFNTLTAFDHSYPMPEIHFQPSAPPDTISPEERAAHHAPRPVSGAPRSAGNQYRTTQSSSDRLLIVSDSTILSSLETRLAYTAPRIQTNAPRNAGSEYSISSNLSNQLQRMPESTILMSAERRIENSMPRIMGNALRNAEPCYGITQNPLYEASETPNSTISMRTGSRVVLATPRCEKSAPRNTDLRDLLQVVQVDEVESGPSGFATRPRSKTVIRSGNWTREERDMLLEWLGRNLGNYEGFKMHVKSTCSKIAVKVFGGARTAEGIRGQWDLMKRKYQKAKQRLNSTGEGQRDDDNGERWASIKLAWLDNMCPHYEQIDDVLKRDRAVTLLFVAESGDTGGSIQFVNGVRQRQISESRLEAEDSMEAPVLLEFSDEDENDTHPPTGGQKTPLSVSFSTGFGDSTMENSIKKGESKGTSMRALKRKRPTTVEGALESIAEKRMMFERTRLEYEKERDEKNFRLMELREQNRHEEAIARWKLMEKKFESQAKYSE